jgi:LPS-assembly lipoprotein
VQPLYAPTVSPGISSPAPLGSIHVAEVDNRVGQQLRNHLIFLLNGGSGQPANPEYELGIKVATDNKSALAIQTTTADEPTAKKVTVTANYKLNRVSDDAVLSNRRARATASYDVSDQEFANIRAERDAEDRAARDVAERLRALIAADLKRAGAI